MTLPKTLATVTTFAFALSMAPAMASLSEVHTQTKEISILGYDLSDRADAERILNKIESTAQSVSRLSQNRSTVRERTLVRRCADKATETAVRSVNSPTLLAVYAETRAR